MQSQDAPATTSRRARRRRAAQAVGTLALGLALVAPGAAALAAPVDPQPSATVSAPSPTCVATAGDTSTVTLTFDNSAMSTQGYFLLDAPENPDRGQTEGSTHLVEAGQTMSFTLDLQHGYSRQIVVRYAPSNNGTIQTGDIQTLADEFRAVDLCETPAPEPSTPVPAPTTPVPGETTAPAIQPVDESALTNAARGSVTTPSRAVRGSAVTVTVGANHAGQQVSAWIYSTPTALGARTVAADGTISVTIPASLTAGAHRIAVLDSAGALIGWDDITVTTGTNAVPKAATGLDEGSSPTGPLLAGGIGIALVTGATIFLRRRSTDIAA